MLGLLLPRTDLGALVQLVATLSISLPVTFVLWRRRSTELLWFVVGITIFMLAFFAFRTVH